MDDLLQEMIDPAPAPKDVPRRRRLWMTIAIVGLAAVGATRLTTAALFTDNQTMGTAITSGTVDIAVTENEFTMPAGNMQPGDVIVMPLVVTNSGSLEHWYAATYSADDTDTVQGTDGGTTGDSHLSDRLTLAVFTGQTACAVPSDTNGATQIATHTGLSRTAGTVLFGNAGTEGAAGNRTLGTGDSETLCLRLTFNAGSPDDNIYQGTATEITLSFFATQSTRP